jgi:hypothetical protein
MDSYICAQGANAWPFNPLATVSGSSLVCPSTQIRIIVGLLFVTFCLADCSLKIYYDYDHNISLKNYKTFGWSEEASEIKKDPAYYSELSDSVIKREVKLQLKNKGYVFTETHPDLRMHYHFVADSWSSLNPDPFGYTYDLYWLDRTMHLYEYRTGTLIIDLMDPKTNFLVWRGWAVNFQGQKKPNQVESQIKKSVQTTFNAFPLCAK